MINSKNMEWPIIIIFLIFNLYVLKNAASMNEDSFNEISKIIFMVADSGGNVRKGPSTGSHVKFTIQSGDFVKPIKRDGKWLYVYHLRSKKEGWMHKVTMGRYLHLGYYRDYVVDKSLLNLSWD